MLFCVLFVCKCACTAATGCVNTIAVNKYIIYRIVSYHISCHVMSYIMSYHVVSYILCIISYISYIIISYIISLLILPLASCTTFSNDLGRIWKESIVAGGTGAIATRVTRSGPRDLERCAGQLLLGMLCRRKRVLGSDSGRCLATVKMHSPEGFGVSVCVCVYVCVCVLLRDRFVCFWCDSSLPIAWTQSHRICSAAWIETWRCASS